mgnify:CR=1 FL=1
MPVPPRAATAVTRTIGSGCCKILRRVVTASAPNPPSVFAAARRTDSSGSSNSCPKAGAIKAPFVGKWFRAAITVERTEGSGSPREETSAGTAVLASAPILPNASATAARTSGISSLSALTRGGTAGLALWPKSPRLSAEALRSYGFGLFRFSTRFRISAWMASCEVSAHARFGKNNKLVNSTVVIRSSRIMLRTPVTFG